MDKELWQVEPGLSDRWLTLRVSQGNVWCWQLSREMRLVVFRGNGRRNIFSLFSVMLTLASIFLVLLLESTLEERVMRRGRGERVPANEQVNCVSVAFFSASSGSVQADQSTVYRKNPDSWIPPLFLQPLTQWPWAKNFTSVGFCFPSCQMVGIKGRTTFWSID